MAWFSIMRFQLCRSIIADRSLAIGECSHEQKRSNGLRWLPNHLGTEGNAIRFSIRTALVLFLIAAVGFAAVRYVHLQRQLNSRIIESHLWHSILTDDEVSRTGTHMLSLIANSDRDSLSTPQIATAWVRPERNQLAVVLLCDRFDIEAARIQLGDGSTINMVVPAEQVEFNRLASRSRIDYQIAFPLSVRPELLKRVALRRANGQWTESTKIITDLSADVSQGVNQVWTGSNDSDPDPEAGRLQ